MMKRLTLSLFILCSLLSALSIVRAQGGIFRTTFTAQGYTRSL